MFFLPDLNIVHPLIADLNLSLICILAAELEGFPFELEVLAERLGFLTEFSD